MITGVSGSGPLAGALVWGVGSVFFEPGLSKQPVTAPPHTTHPPRPRPVVTRDKHFNKSAQMAI